MIYKQTCLRRLFHRDEITGDATAKILSLRIGAYFGFLFNKSNAKIRKKTPQVQLL